MYQMDYASMSLIELKQLAKDKQIKYYYMKPKTELVELLSLNDLPTYIKLQKITIKKLREEAKEKQVERIWAKSRQQLVEVLYPEFVGLLYPHKTGGWKNQHAADQDKQYHSYADKHDDPQQHDTQ